MAADLSGIAIVAGVLLPAFAAAVWAITLERRPRRAAATPAADPDPEPDWTVAGIQARLRFEQASRRLAEAGTIGLPTLPIPQQTGPESSPDRLPWRVPRTVPPPRPASGRVPASRYAFAPPDTDLMRRILEGLRKLD